MLDRTEVALDGLLWALQAHERIQRRVLNVLGCAGGWPLYTEHMPRMPHMIPGNDRATLLANSLALINKGFTKGEAMAIALNVAGYRPPPVTPTSIHRAPGQRRPVTH